MIFIIIGVCLLIVVFCVVFVYTTAKYDQESHMDIVIDHLAEEISSSLSYDNLNTMNEELAHLTATERLSNEQYSRAMELKNIVVRRITQL